MGRQNAMERGWSGAAVTEAVKPLLLGSLFIYYLYLAYFQNRLEVAFNKNH